MNGSRTRGPRHSDASVGTPAPSPKVIAESASNALIGLPGHATEAGTLRYQSRFTERMAGDFYRVLADRLCTSSIGLGTYLGECDDEADAAARAVVRAALARGINLFDSAINYRCQRSERTIGDAVRAAIESGTIARDEIVICTKGGFVPLEGTPPASREAYQHYLQERFFDRGVMAPDDVVAGGHCLAPGFLANQVETSRANLGLKTIDVYYLHNPEVQREALGRDGFRVALRHAFAALEAKVATREIGCYGVATWHGLRVAPDHPQHLALGELVSLAREVGGERHHFAVVQAPVNLAMSEAVRMPTQSLGKRGAAPALQVASDLGISLVASAALMQGQLARGLPDQLRDALPGFASDAQRAIAFVRALPGVCAALVGTKSLEHLEENVGAGAA